MVKGSDVWWRNGEDSNGRDASIVHAAKNWRQKVAGVVAAGDTNAGRFEWCTKHEHCANTVQYL